MNNSLNTIWGPFSFVGPTSWEVQGRSAPALLKSYLFTMKCYYTVTFSHWGTVSIMLD